MQVKDCMSRNLTTSSSSTSLLTIWNLIFKKHVHSVPIVDKNKKLLGIVAEADLLQKLFPDYQDVLPDFSAGEDLDSNLKEKISKLKKVPAEKVMSKNIYFTRPDTNVMRALSRMIVHHLRQLPVLDDKDRLVGMISKHDVFSKVFQKDVKKFLRKF